MPISPSLTLVESQQINFFNEDLETRMWLGPTYARGFLEAASNTFPAPAFAPACPLRQKPLARIIALSSNCGHIGPSKVGMVFAGVHISAKAAGPGSDSIDG